MSVGQPQAHYKAPAFDQKYGTDNGRFLLGAGPEREQTGAAGSRVSCERPPLLKRNR